MAYLGEEIKKLGFGLMRLPQKDGVIDIEQTKQMTDLFLEAGFTYFDTAWAYAGSEDAIRQALVERYPRSRFQLATKNAAWINCRSREEAAAQFDTSLKQTGAGYFDFYLLHNLGESRTHFFDDYDMWGFVQEKKAQGLIKHVGFSFHSTPEELDELLTRHPEMEFVQLQINYADWEDPEIQSRKCYEMCVKYNKAVIVMEPVKGGALVDIPKEAVTLLKKEDAGKSIASWAIRFAASLDNVVIVLSGMGSEEQMNENTFYMGNFQRLTKKEEKVINKVAEIIRAKEKVDCTVCRYCTDKCPKNIAIPDYFKLLNRVTQFGEGQIFTAKQSYVRRTQVFGKASDCICCGQCEDCCPQHLHITRYLKDVVKMFE